MAFVYDVFVSYNRADQAWARWLADSLTQGVPKANVFFAPDSLRAGDLWENEVEQALNASRHLVVLWSPQAKESDWVSREMYTFFGTAKPLTPQAGAGRRMVFVNLAGANTAFTQLQQINLPAVQQAYVAGAAAPPAEWDALVVALRKGLEPNMRPLPIPVAVLAMTRPEFDQLEAKRRQWIEADFRVSPRRLAVQYGAGRRDWRPFGGQQSVDQVLAEAAALIDKTIANRRCEWVWPGAGFWDDKQAAKQFVDQTFETGELSLLLVDPASLSHPDVFERLMLFQNCLSSPSTVILTLAPLGVPYRLRGLKAALRSRATPYFDDLLQPKLPLRRPVAARCSWNATDADDIGLQLIVAATQAGRDESLGAARPAFLQQGGG